MPQETFFDVHDFLVFAEMEWSCKELPAQDVEGCIRHLREHAPELDPLSPTDRERMQLQINTTSLIQRENTNRSLARTEEELSQEKKAGEERVELIAEQLRQKDSEFLAFRQQVELTDRKNRAQRLRNEAVLRIVAIVICDIFLLILVGQLAAHIAIGSTVEQRLIGNYVLFAAVIGLIAPATWILVGRQRLQELWWPARKILGVEK